MPSASRTFVSGDTATLDRQRNEFEDELRRENPGFQLIAATVHNPPCTNSLRSRPPLNTRLVVYTIFYNVR